jgi:phenylalanyl-tRNA synthetase beta chain
MRVPVSWLADYVELPADVDLADLTHRLTMLGLKLERLESPGADVTGPLVVGRVQSFESEEHSNGKTIRWCRVDVGPEHNDDDGGRGIVCGAHNFEVDDLVVVSLPGAVLPGGFAISARTTYGHVSDGMICSARELGLGDDHAGIIVLEPDAGKPGDDARAVLFLVDDVIELEIAPDRGYALSIRGVAREAAMALDLPFRDPAAIETPPVDDGAYPVVVDDPEGCPVFVTRVVTGVDVTRRTPRWMARRLQLAGMRPLSLAVDITNYVMLELGQPIHGYDRAKLRGPIRVRRATPGEQLTTLDDVRRALDPDDLLITDDSGPIGLAGVMGGASTELGAETTEIVIEAAHFNPVTISRTSRRHRLPSEASKRFERGVDPALPRFAAQRVADLLAEYAGGRVIESVTMAGEPPFHPTLDIAASLPRDVIGMPVSDEDTAAALRSVGCEVETTGDRLQVAPPTWRPDLVDPYDLVEEVARIVGYDKLPSVVPPAPPGQGLTHSQTLRRRIGRALAGIGLVEVSTYPFVGSAAWDGLGLPEHDVRRRAIRIANPLSDEEPFLTTSLVPGLLRAAARNVSRGHEDTAIFEVAPVFLPDAEPTAAPILDVDRRPTSDELQRLYGAVPVQPLHLAAVLTGHRDRDGWWGRGRPVCPGTRAAVRRSASTVW